MKKSIHTTALLFLAAIIWGFAFVAQVDGVNYIGPFTLNGLRFCIGALSLVPVALIFERGRVPRDKQKKTLFASLLAGVVLFFASTIQQIGIQKTGSAGVSGFFTGLYMLLVPIACLIIFKKKSGINIWIGAALGLIGLCLLCIKPNEGFSFGIGELCLLIGAVLWTAHVIIIDRLAKDIRPLHFSLGQFAICGLLGLVAMFVFEEPSISGIMNARVSLLYCGVLSVGVAYTLQVIGQKKADPAFAAIVFSTESIFSAIGGKLFGVDNISTVGYIGCAIMFCGILISQVDLKKRKSDK